MTPSKYPIGTRVLVNIVHSDMKYKTMVAFTIQEWSGNHLYVCGKADNDGQRHWYEVKSIEVLDTLAP